MSRKTPRWLKSAMAEATKPQHQLLFRRRDVRAISIKVEEGQKPAAR